MVKVNTVEIFNCLSFTKSQLGFDNGINFVVGPNDSGKTNLFRTFSLVQYVLLHKDQKDWWSTVRQYFHNANTIGHLELKIGLSLDAYELDYLAFFLEYCERSRANLDSQNNDEGKIKKNMLRHFSHYLSNKLFKKGTLSIIIRDPSFYIEPIIVSLKTSDNSSAFFASHYQGETVLTKQNRPQHSKDRVFLTDLIYDFL